MDLSPPFTVIEGGCNKDNLLDMENEKLDNVNEIKQVAIGKPPRHLSAMRHCVSTTRLNDTADLVCSFYMITFKFYLVFESSITLDLVGSLDVLF